MVAEVLNNVPLRNHQILKREKLALMDIRQVKYADLLSPEDGQNLVRPNRPHRLAAAHDTLAAPHLLQHVFIPVHIGGEDKDGNVGVSREFSDRFHQGKSCSLLAVVKRNIQQDQIQLIPMPEDKIPRLRQSRRVLDMVLDVLRRQDAADHIAVIDKPVFIIFHMQDLVYAVTHCRPPPLAAKSAGHNK